MALPPNDYGKYVEVPTPAWPWPRSQAQACWWLTQHNRMCLLGMYELPYKMAYKCADGHETSHHEILARKR